MTSVSDAENGLLRIAFPYCERVKKWFKTTWHVLKTSFRYPTYPCASLWKGQTLYRRITWPLSCSYTKIGNTGWTVVGNGYDSPGWCRSAHGCGAAEWQDTLPIPAGTSLNLCLGIIMGSITGSTAYQVPYKLQVALAAAAPDPCLSPCSLSWGNRDSQFFSVLHFPGLPSSSVIQRGAWYHEFCPWTSLPWS